MLTYRPHWSLATSGVKQSSELRKFSPFHAVLIQMESSQPIVLSIPTFMTGPKCSSTTAMGHNILAVVQNQFPTKTNNSTFEGLIMSYKQSDTFKKDLTFLTKIKS